MNFEVVNTHSIFDILYSMFIISLILMTVGPPRGKPVIPLLWVLIRNPEGLLEPVALLSTDQQLYAQDIVSYFVPRWSVE